MEFSKVIKTRRTHKKFNGEAVPKALLRGLLELAITAPCHRRNEPWRFTVIFKEEMSRFTEVINKSCEEVFASMGEEFLNTKRSDLQKKLANVGAVVMVSYTKDAAPVIDQENYAATCCAIQNLMLAATDKGIGSFWSTGTPFSAKNTLQALRIDQEKENFAGAIWLGFPTESPEAPKYDLESKIRIWN